jgi:hypothetical protein
MIDFPASPTLGQAFVDPATGLQWVWDGTKWKASGLATPPLPVPMNDNRLINGDMRIDQRNGGASGTAYNYTVDRWQCTGTVAGQFTWQQTNNGGCPGFPYALRAISNSAHTVAAADTFYILQPIEADMVSDFQWGAAGAQPVTLSFWVYCTLTGTFSGVIGATVSAAPFRSYPFTYSIPVANTWTKIAITIPGDTIGPWVMSGNSGAINLLFDLGSGANYHGPANAWASANYVGATGAVNLVASNGAGILFTGVKLEIGSVATSYNRQSLAKSLADCQRYYVGNGYFNYAGFATEIAPISISQTFPTNMRAPPTIVVTPQGSLNITNPLVGPVDGTYYAVGGQSTAAGNFIYYGTFTASAEL